MNDELRRKELAEFLKNRRNRTRPEEVGLSSNSNSHRRTKGLRREEVAVLSGISVPWYTSLEQGRDVRISDSVIESLARTLKLSRDERIHLYVLADRKIPLESVLDVSYLQKSNPELQRIVDQYMHLPAYTIDGQWNLLVWNQAAIELFGLQPNKMKNCSGNLIWLMFNDPVVRGRYADWEDSARKLLGAFRYTYARRMEDPYIREIITQLLEVNEDFKTIWELHDVQCFRDDNHFKIQHPSAGEINVFSNPFYAAEYDDVTLVLYTPEGVADQKKLINL
ncbi:helix-turn-helix transcriptional regulator [Paenibacillus jiagnxiensis]|uniref:helix-turn-helix transcriptional regulator n=1 Tax=Paenibacillus jiagnxiensis TaxID=3228926 RepID=UPI0033A3F0A5